MGLKDYDEALRLYNKFEAERDNQKIKNYLHWVVLISI